MKSDWTVLLEAIAAFWLIMLLGVLPVVAVTAYAVSHF
jgi:cbb3-type cytochrome oxidase subunit 3